MSNMIIICNKYGDSTFISISEILNTDIPSTNIAFKSIVSSIVTYTSINKDLSVIAHDYKQRVPLVIN